MFFEQLISYPPSPNLYWTTASSKVFVSNFVSLCMSGTYERHYILSTYSVLSLFFFPSQSPRFPSSKCNYAISRFSVELLLLFLLLMLHLLLWKHKPRFINSAFYVLYFISLLFVLSFSSRFSAVSLHFCLIFELIFVVYNIFNLKASS